MNYIFSKLWIAINVKQFSPVYNILVLIKELAVESTSGRSIQFGWLDHPSWLDWFWKPRLLYKDWPYSE